MINSSILRFRLVDVIEEQLANLVVIWAPVEEWRLEVYFEVDERSLK